MKNIKEFFEIVKLNKFIPQYTSMNVAGGIYSRVNGKGTMKGTLKELTDNDKEQIKAGLDAMITDMQNLKEHI